MDAVLISHFLLEAALKSAAVLLAAMLLTLLMRGASAAVRHLVWTAAIVISLLLPMSSLVPTNRRIVVPALTGIAAPPVSTAAAPIDSLRVNVPADAETTQADSTRSLVAPVVEANQPSAAPAIGTDVNRVERVAVLLWLVGAILVGTYWLIGMFAAWLIQRSPERLVAGRLWMALQSAQQQIGLRRNVVLRVGAEIGMPLTVHTWRPQIFLPAAAAEWSDEQLQSALLHELAHVKRLDCAVQWLTHWACAAYWFNPLIWIAAVRLRLERERACDDLVLNLGANPANYAEHLLAVARALRGGFQWQTGAIAMARSSGLRQRLTDILNSHVNRRAMSARLVGLAAMMILAAGIPLSCVQLGAKNQTKPAQAVAAAPSAKPQAVREVATPTTQAARILHLTVVNAETGAPVQGAGVNYGMGGPDIATTDAQGHADVPMGGGATISVWCSHYINHRLTWEHGVPSEYTYRLDPASSIGGKVVDDAGQPVEGANVEIYVNGSGTHNGDEFIEMPWINRAVTTAADGTWHFDRVPLHPTKPIKVAVWDYQHLDGNFFFLKEYTPQSALRDKTATFTLHKSVVISGTVVDPFYGKPIPKAKVSFGDDQSASNKIPPLTADDKGAFKVAAQPGCKLFITVSADGYRPEVKQQVVSDKPEDWEFDLSPTNWVH